MKLFAIFERIIMNLSEIFLSDGTLSPTLILWLFYIAAVIGTVIYFTVNYQLGKIVTRLLELEATTPETAVSIEDAKLKTGFFTKICLCSAMNYKDLLVAITADGKYYANMRYTDEPPTFKLLRAITRKRKSRIKDKKSQNFTASEEQSTASNTAVDTETDINADQNNGKGIEIDVQAADIDTEAESQAEPNAVAATDTDSADILAKENTENPTEVENPQSGVSRVDFNPFTAKYYIPKEVHDKAKGIYKPSKANVLLIIAALIGLGVIIYFTGFLLDGMIDSLKSLGK